MSVARPTILSFVIFGAAVAGSMLAGIGLWLFRSHRVSVATTAAGAEAEFSQLRARFSHQQPLLDMTRREVNDEIPNAAAPPRSFHTVIFDTRGGSRIVRISVPFWLARRFAGADRQYEWLGQLTFLDDTEFDPERIRLPLDRVERRGPGLVAYQRHPSGGPFISWVE